MKNNMLASECGEQYLFGVANIQDWTNPVFESRSFVCYSDLQVLTFFIIYMTRMLDQYFGSQFLDMTIEFQ